VGLMIFFKAIAVFSPVFVKGLPINGYLRLQKLGKNQKGFIKVG